MKPGAKVLIVEDEEAVSGFVSRSLEIEGYSTVICPTGGQALADIASSPPKVVVLDLMLPDMDGLDLLAKIRELTSAPVIAVTARSDWADRVKGLNRGADDYLTKPFRIEELIARVKALLRRARSSSDTLEIGELFIDLKTRTVTYRKRKLFLSTTEFEILEILAENAGKPVARKQILEQVWDDRSRDTNVVEVYISYLRNKLEKSDSPPIIATIRGKGYMLRMPKGS